MPTQMFWPRAGAKAPAAFGAEFLGLKQTHERAVAALEQAPRCHKDALPILSITLTNDH